MYSLLTPGEGILLSNGFLFKFNDSEEVQGFPRGNENILANDNTTLLLQDYCAGRDAGQFLLMRHNENELEIPLKYTGNVHFIGPRYQCASEVVTVLERGSLVKPSLKDRDYIEGSPKLYCNNDDQQCKNLYDTLKQGKLFYRTE